MTDLLTVDDLAAWLQVPKGTIFGWNSRGVGPRRIRAGKRVLYRRSDVEAWLDSRTVAGEERG